MPDYLPVADGRSCLGGHTGRQTLRRGLIRSGATHIFDTVFNSCVQMRSRGLTA